MPQHLTERMQAGTRPLHQGADICLQSRLSSPTRPGAPRAQNRHQLNFYSQNLAQTSSFCSKVSNFSPFLFPPPKAVGAVTAGGEARVVKISANHWWLCRQKGSLKILKCIWRCWRKRRWEQRGKKGNQRQGAGKRDFYLEERQMNRPGIHPAILPHGGKKKKKKSLQRNKSHLSTWKHFQTDTKQQNRTKD